MQGPQWTWILALLMTVSLAWMAPGAWAAEEAEEDEAPKESKADAGYREMFERYRVIAEGARPDSFILYEGPPRFVEASVWEEMKAKQFEMFGYPFYKESQVIQGEAAKEVLEILLDPKMFKVYGGPKFCGGFHPDYSVVISDVGTVYHFLICTGCHEVVIGTLPDKKLSENPGVIGMDIPEATFDRLWPRLINLEKARAETNKRSEAVEKAQREAEKNAEKEAAQD